MNKLTLLALASTTCLLAACGGGGSALDDAQQGMAREVPASATASSRAYSEYVGSLSADDRNEPLSVDKVVAPVSETEEPIPVS